MKKIFGLIAFSLLFISLEASIPLAAPIKSKKTDYILSKNTYKMRQPQPNFKSHNINGGLSLNSSDIEEVIALSKEKIITTISENNNVYAIGFINNKFFKTQVLAGVSKSFGIYKGLLAIARQKNGFVGNDLIVVDLRSGKEEIILPDYSVYHAEWNPDGQQIGVIFHWGKDYGLLIHNLQDNKPNLINQSSAYPELLRFSENGGTLFFIEKGDNHDQKEMSVVRYDVSSQSEVRTKINDAEMKQLPLISDEQLFSGDYLPRKTTIRMQRASLEFNDKDEPVINLISNNRLQTTLRNSFPIKRMPEGVLIRSLELVKPKLLLWRFGSRTILEVGDEERALEAILPEACGIQPSSFYLSFPLPNRTAYSIKINSAFDHVNPTYNPDSPQHIVAYTGEEGKFEYGYSTQAYVGGGRGLKNLGRVGFVLNGQDFDSLLYYDGHDGFDFKTIDQPNNGKIDVKAVADGDLRYIDDCYNTVEINHRNGYVTRYLHMSSPVKPPSGQQTVFVKRGDRIGTADGVGTDNCKTGTVVHLHFTLLKGGQKVDPYGWQGQYPDPNYTRTNERSSNLWKPQAYAACNVRWHPDGTLINMDGAIYLIEGGEKRLIPNQTVFYAYGFDFANAINISKEEFDCLPNGSTLGSPPSPRLRKLSNNTIYEVTDRTRKRAFPSAAIFQGQGFRWDEVQAGNVDGIQDDPNIPIYNSIFREGTLLVSKNGGAIYVISNAKKRRFNTTENVFLSMGYRLADVIPVSDATLGDIQSGSDITESLVTQCQSGANPILTVSPASQDFGSVQVGSSSDRSFTVQNTGTGTLSGNATVSSPYSIVSGGSYNLGANQSQTINVRFSPTATQTYNQNITFTGGSGTTKQLVGVGTPSCTSAAISIGQTVNGSLATNDCRSPLRSNRYADRYTFNGTAGQKIAISVNGFDTYLYLLSSGGAILREDDDGGTNAGSRIPAVSGYYTLPTTGSYTIEVTSYAQNLTGSYVLSIIQDGGGGSNCTPNTISIGQTVNGSLTTSDCRSPLRANRYADRYTFNGTAGQRVALLVSGFDTYLYLLNSTGTVLREDDDGGLNGGSRIPAVSGYYTLPTTGSYTIEVTSYAQNASGNYALSIIQDGGGGSNCTPNTISIGQTVNGSLTTSDCLSPLRAGRYADRYTFNGTAGQKIAISVNGFDSYLYLLNSSGTVLREDDDGGTNGGSRIPAGSGYYTLSASGTYTIEVSSYGPNTTSNYSLTILLSP